MTDDFSGPNVLKLSGLVVIFLHGLSITIVGAGDSVANVTEYNDARVPSNAFPSSPVPVTRYRQIDEKAQRSPEDSAAKAVVDLVEAPVEVIGPQIVEPGDSRAVVRASEKRDVRPVVSDEGEDEEYEDDDLGGSGMILGNEVGDDVDNDDADDVVVVDNDQKRRDLIVRRKAGRCHRQGPKIWDQWGKWTSCSVSCGAGKLTRWRHCVAGGCSLGEKEAQLKTCTFSAC